MPRALLSVSNKDGLVELADGLRRRGLELVSTGGTARTLADAGLPVTSVSDVTRFPEMMDGRVKTLHPLIHGGILARRDHPDDLVAAERHGIGLVDVVVVNLYPFVQTAARPDVPFEALIEQIDIGGPSMVRAAAKNFRTSSSWSIRPTTRWCSRHWTRQGGRPRPSASSWRARRLRTPRRTTPRLRPPSARSTPATATSSARRPATTPCLPGSCWTCPSCGTCATARTPIRRRRGTAAGARALARSKCCRARNCRSPTCSTSTRPRASCSSSASRPPP